MPFSSIATVLYDNEPEILDDMNDTVADVLDEHSLTKGYAYMFQNDSCLCMARQNGTMY